MACSAAVRGLIGCLGIDPLCDKDGTILKSNFCLAVGLVEGGGLSRQRSATRGVAHSRDNGSADRRIRTSRSRPTSLRAPPRYVYSGPHEPAVMVTLAPEFVGLIKPDP
jgi:hypothetical protein